MLAGPVLVGARVVHLRDEQGRPDYGPDGSAVTVTVTAWWGSNSRIPIGPPVTVEARGEPVASESVRDRAIDHVHAWTGVLYQGVPAECTRNMVDALFLAQPHFYREVVRAIRLAGTAGAN